jgi:6-pyruvoyltetrahydropterin/6-carboxytetrahydropterin synthase
MYQITVEDHFDAAHFLRGYKGKCEALHGHRFRVVVRVNAAGLDSIGLAYDFTELKQHLAETVRHLDHVCLNDQAPFDKENPSSENLAVYIYQDMEKRLPPEPAHLSAVEVWESPVTSVTYSPDLGTPRE